MPPAVDLPLVLLAVALGVGWAALVTTRPDIVRNPRVAIVLNTLSAFLFSAWYLHDPAPAHERTGPAGVTVLSVMAVVYSWTAWRLSAR